MVNKPETIDWFPHTQQSNRFISTYPQLHLNSPSQYNPNASRKTAKMAVTVFIIICAEEKGKIR